MKQVAKLLTLLILFVSFAGFGHTTTDLEQNSEITTSFFEESESVVISFDFEVKIQACVNDRVIEIGQSIVEKEILFRKNLTKLEATKNNNYKINYHSTPLNTYLHQTHRNPRDGIRLFFS